MPAWWRSLHSPSAASASRWSHVSGPIRVGRLPTSSGEKGAQVTNFLKNPRILVAGLAAIALVLSGLIFRDVFVPAKNTSSSLNLYTVGRRTVTSSVTGTGNLVPMTQSNVSFRVSGILTEVDVRVGDHVTAGQVLARIDPTAEQQALSAAQANL